MLVNLEAPPWATHLISDLTDWQRTPLPVAEMRPFELPDDVYFEYAYVNADGQRLPDPQNTNFRLNPWWEYASNLTGPNYLSESTALVGDTKALGTLRRLVLDSKLLGQSRHILIYTPAGFQGVSLPLVMFQDGKAYLGWGKVPQVLDRLLAAEEIRPAHLVFIPPASRTQEYAFNDQFLESVVVEMLPYIESQIVCSGERIVWGASLSGLFSAQLAWEFPELFQKVVSQSGAFLFSPDMDMSNVFAGNESFLRQIQFSSPKSLQWYLECGTMDWLLPSNERLFKALQDQGEAVTFSTRNAGHNWMFWRNGLAGGLRFALGM